MSRLKVTVWCRRASSAPYPTLLVPSISVVAAASITAAHKQSANGWILFFTADFGLPFGKFVQAFPGEGVVRVDPKRAAEMRFRLAQLPLFGVNSAAFAV